jgi:hypothetical protein
MIHNFYSLYTNTFKSRSILSFIAIIFLKVIDFIIEGP